MIGADQVNWSDPLHAVFLGAVGSLVASALFLLLLRAIHPRIEISPDIVWRLEADDAEGSERVYRVKLLNLSRLEAVNIKIEMARIKTGLSAKAAEHNWFMRRILRRSTVNASKDQRKPLDFRPQALDMLPKYRAGDEDVKYAFRIRTSEDLASIIENEHMHVRVRVYAEHPISRRASIFERTYSVKSQLRQGDFCVGRTFSIDEHVDVTDTQIPSAPPAAASPTDPLPQQENADTTNSNA